MIRLKNKSVNITQLDPVMWRAAVAVDDLMAKYKRDAIITSGNDGKHMDASKHYQNQALDFRTYHLPGGYLGLTARDVATRLTAQLKPLGFDVVLENDHIHLEHDPKPKG